jgi:xylulokinase
MYGSSTFLIQKTEKLIFSSDYAGAVFLQDGNFVLAGGVSTAGSLTRWFRDEFGYKELQIEKEKGINAYTSLSLLAEKAPKGANGIVVLPFFSGQADNLGEKGVIYGLNLTHTRSDVFRAILESIGFLIRDHFEKMVLLGGYPSKVFAVGGGIKNRLWLQIVSDITGITQYIPDCNFGASYGDAFIAAIGINEYESISEIGKWVKVKEIITPEKDSQKFYDDKYLDFKKLSSKLFSNQ